MDSREIVRRTLDFESPERVARSFGESDFAWTKCSALSRAPEWRDVGGGRSERADEWGNTWARVDPTSMGEVARGALDGDDGLARAGETPFPDVADPAGYRGAAREREANPERWLLAGLPGFAFSLARKLRRLDRYLVDLYEAPEAVHALHDRIDDLLEVMIRRFAAAGADGVMFAEDWGTQDRLMIPPALWREEFAPRFERLCGVAHGCGVRVFMHSCGMIGAIIPDLVRAGVDCLQLDQPELHGTAALAAHQDAGRITFWCPVDIQRTLQSRDERAVGARAREMLDKLWRGRGGFIAGFYGDEVSIGLEPRWQRAACEEFVAWGVASRYARA